jgi:hypothetical protein
MSVPADAGMLAWPNRAPPFRILRNFEERHGFAEALRAAVRGEPCSDGEPSGEMIEMGFGGHFWAPIY